MGDFGLCLNIANVRIGITFDLPIRSVNLDRALNGFLSECDPDLQIHAHFGAIPEINLNEREVVFNSQALWKLYHCKDKYLFVFQRQYEQSPYRVAIFNSEFIEGEVFSRQRAEESDTAEAVPDPLEFPLGELLMISLLAKGRGVLIHACGIDCGGRGYLFAGHSTHGKSTMASLWRNTCVVLNDDRMVVRHEGGCFRMYGTPWHGDYSGVSPNGVPIDKVFFLSRGDTNQVKPVGGSVAAAQLMARLFAPFWDADGMRFTLDLVADIVAEVPFYELNFVPSSEIVDFVLAPVPKMEPFESRQNKKGNISITSGIPEGE